MVKTTNWTEIKNQGQNTILYQVFDRLNNAKVDNSVHKVIHPTASFSARMARYCKPFVVSIILGYDIVPRLSIPTLNDLKWRLLSALQGCRVPKYQILSRAAQIVGLNCLLPACCRPLNHTIGLDKRLFDETCQRNLLHPKVISPKNPPTTSTSTAPLGAYEAGMGTMDSITGKGGVYTTSVSPHPSPPYNKILEKYFQRWCLSGGHPTPTTTPGVEPT